MLKFHNPELNILVSYVYYKKGIDDALRKSNTNLKLVIDSGAFTAWKKGKELKVEDYCDFLKKMPLKPWKYFNLDVIGNPKKTLKNYEYMLSEGLNPIPIFTRGEDHSMIDEYYKTSDIVGIGGLVGTPNKNNALKKAMHYIGDRKVHWLGFTNLNYIKHYKPYMCDSSTASVMLRFASGTLYLGNGKTVTLNKKVFCQRPPQEIINRLSEFNIDINLLKDKKNWNRINLQEIGYMSSVSLMLDLKRKLGVNMFIAIKDLNEINKSIECYKHLIKGSE